MNVENILKVADAIEARSIAWLGFNVRSWYADRNDGISGIEYKDQSGHKCGTVACIAGWATAVEIGETGLTEEFEAIRLRGKQLINLPLVSTPEEFLGIDQEQANDLFYGAEDDTTPEKAVIVLRNLAETGVVDWTV